MYAVIKTGGKQYKVAAGDEVVVEKLACDSGDVVQFTEVLMLGDGDAVTVGAPRVEDAGVLAQVLDQFRGEKVYTFHKRRRKHSSKRLRGHRQSLTSVKITEILKSGAGSTETSSEALNAAEPSAGVKFVRKMTAEELAAAGAAAAAAASVADASHSEEAADAAPVEATAELDPDAPAEAPEEAPAEPVDAERPSNLLDEAKGEADDLTKISGVGPKLNTLLNENGVYHFWQISEWGAAEIAYMDDKLSFKGRIERDNWIEQAKTLAAENG